MDNGLTPLQTKILILVRHRYRRTAQIARELDMPVKEILIDQIALARYGYLDIQYRADVPLLTKATLTPTGASAIGRYVYINDRLYSIEDPNPDSYWNLVANYTRV